MIVAQLAHPLPGFFSLNFLGVLASAGFCFIAALISLKLAGITTPAGGPLPIVYVLPFSLGGLFLIMSMIALRRNRLA